MAATNPPSPAHTSRATSWVEDATVSRRAEIPLTADGAGPGAGGSTGLVVGPAAWPAGPAIATGVGGGSSSTSRRGPGEDGLAGVTDTRTGRLGRPAPVHHAVKRPPRPGRGGCSSDGWRPSREQD